MASTWIWSRGLAVAALAMALGGCGTGVHTAARRVAVTERDFHIGAPAEVAAGLADLSVHNTGPDSHELIVVREGGSRVPMRADGITVDEDTLKPVTVGTLEPADPGARRHLLVRLKPGRYVLFCNMAGHFRGGMHTDLVVR
jgi:uncharacterized cupredoxin-like copper-binding protein